MNQTITDLGGLKNTLVDGGSGISIIIAAYNAELYIERCLNSILQSKCNGVEVVVVDDGSTDNTFTMVRDYQKRHDGQIAIKLLHQDNGGGYRRRGIMDSNLPYTITFGLWMLMTKLIHLLSLTCLIYVPKVMIWYG